MRLQRVKMRNDAIDVKVNKGLLAFWTEEECAADRKAESLSCVANESGSQRPRIVRRWLEPSLLNGAAAE